MEGNWMAGDAERKGGKKEGCDKKGKGRSSGLLLPALSIGGSILLYLALVFGSASSGAGQEIHHLKRDGYAGEERTVSLLVEGLEAEAVPVTVTVSPRVYTKEEAEQLFYNLMDEMGEMIRGENPSLSEVMYDLNLPVSDEASGVRFQWQSSEPEYLSSSGQLEDRVSEEMEVILYVKLTADGQEADFEIPVRLVPGNRSAAELQLEQLQTEIRERDIDQREAEYLELPLEQDGMVLSYRDGEQEDYTVVPLLGVLMAVLFAVREKENVRIQEKQRERELLLDHAEVLSKLMVLIGAGMTIRSAWERVVKDYENGLKAGKHKPRPAYEEMRHTCYQLANGMPEGAAYREFGRRCRLQPYLKLSSMLEQNRKAGVKNLRAILRTEMEDAFELRKNLARRMGEEADTKLLLPLFMMLGIVMVMIMVPAMMSMG